MYAGHASPIKVGDAKLQFPAKAVKLHDRRFDSEMSSVRKQNNVRMTSPSTWLVRTASTYRFRSARLRDDQIRHPVRSRQTRSIAIKTKIQSRQSNRGRHEPVLQVSTFTSVIYIINFSKKVSNTCKVHHYELQERCRCGKHRIMTRPYILEILW